MISVTLTWIAEKVGGRLVGEDKTISKVSTDTRDDLTGALFIALKGPNFDAHRFTEQARQGGAEALLVEKPQQTELSQIVVENTRYALGLLGAAVKAEVAPKTVAITGSNGKTTVKEMLSSILSLKDSTLATAGNFNNDIGVPLTLLRLEPQHEFAVIELGANHIGEIAYTTGLTQPDVAIINNVAPAHVEGFGSVHGVYRAKSEIFRGLGPNGLAMTPFHSEFAQGWAQQLAQLKHETFGQAVSESTTAEGEPAQPTVRARHIQLCSALHATFCRRHTDRPPWALVNKDSSGCWRES